jgi:peptide/nickel transport system permease protein
VVVVVFFLFQGFGDPARLVLGQAGDSTTIKNIRKELALDQPKWKQFVLYLNDVSPVAVHSKEEIQKKQLKGFFIGGEKNSASKFLTCAVLIKPKKMWVMY